MLPGGCADRLVSSEVSVARRLRLTVAAVAALVITPWPAARAVGPQTAADTLGRSPGRLFDTAEPIAFTLTSDLGAVAKDRGTQSWRTSSPTRPPGRSRPTAPIPGSSLRPRAGGGRPSPASPAPPWASRR